MKRNYRKESKGLEDFLKRRKKQISFIRERDKQRSVSRSFELREREIIEVGNKLRSLCQGTNGGQGVLFVFPLTKMIGTGEFIKGLLKVIAPKARVNFVVTPKSFYSTVDQRLSQIKKEKLKSLRDTNLEKNSKSIFSGKKSKVIVVDDFAGGSGDTRKNLQKNATKNNYGGELKFVDSFSFINLIGNFFGVERGAYNLGWKKDVLGGFAMDAGNVIRFVKKNGNIKTKYGFKGVDKKGRTLEYSDYKGNSEVSPKTKTKISNAQRNYLYHLGIAVGKDFLFQKV